MGNRSKPRTRRLLRAFHAQLDCNDAIEDSAETGATMELSHTLERAEYLTEVSEFSRVGVRQGAADRFFGTDDNGEWTVELTR